MTAIKTSKKTRRSSGSKSTKVTINVALDLHDVVRVAGWDKADKMLSRLIAFAGNKKGSISLKVTSPK